MGYTQLIDRSLRRTFNQLKDLAVEVTFNLKTDATFDFATASTSFGNMSDVTTKVVVLSTKQKFFNKDTKTRQILVKSIDVPDVGFYSTVTFGSEVWHIITPLHNKGFITLIELSKEP